MLLDNQISFEHLVSTFATSGMIGLGKIPNPATNELEKNLDQAKFSIDTLLLLQEKTKGNLTDEEEKFLKNTIGTLQMNYIEESK